MCEHRRAGQLSAISFIAGRPGAGARNASGVPVPQTTTSPPGDAPDAANLGDASQTTQSVPAKPGQQAEVDQAQDQMAEVFDPEGEPEPSDAPDRMQEAMDAAAEIAEKSDNGLGTPGRPINKRSPFFIGMAAAFGVAVAYGLVEVIVRARSVLIIIGLAMFIAAGLDPAVNWLTRRGLARPLAVLIILLAAAGVIGGFLAAAIPPLAGQATSLGQQLPQYMHSLQNHNSELGKLNDKFQVQQRLTKLLSSRGGDLVGGVLGAGELVLSAATEVLAVAVLTIYFLVGMPRLKLFLYRLAPQSRRARVILIGDEIFVKVGGYVLGNFLTSAIAGVGTYIWLLVFHVPYPLLLALLVALLDLIPVIGSTIGGVICTLVALTVSLPVALATLGFYIFYRLAEDYLIVPRILGRTVDVPAVVTLVAVLIGGTLMGIIGALVAIPVAAALRLLLNEVAFHRLDSS
jgi:predicted PurR-regulated permease PerM